MIKANIPPRFPDGKRQPPKTDDNISATKNNRTSLVADINNVKLNWSEISLS